MPSKILQQIMEKPIYLADLYLIGIGCEKLTVISLDMIEDFPSL